VILSISGCAQQQSSDENKAAPAYEMKAVANVQELMESLVAHMAEDIWNSVKTEIDKDGVHEYKPKNKMEWDEVRYSAMGLAETANLLMMDGRAVDQGNWAKHSKGLMDTSLAVAKAAKEENADGVLEAGGNVYEHCKGCHDEYLQQVEKKRTGGKPAETPLTAPPGFEKK
jgi:isoleucyl-tRNA synthetase